MAGLVSQEAISYTIRLVHRDRMTIFTRSHDLPNQNLV